MKVKIVAVGKIKESYFKLALDEYLKRISRFATIEIVEVNECLFKGEPNLKEIEKIIVTEGKEILQKVEGYVFAMDIGGNELTSPQLAEKISLLKQQHNVFTFVIGGSNGLSDEVKQRADYRLSFGKITLPHQLCRVVLTEQIYRAFCIQNNVPYHK